MPRGQYVIERFIVGQMEALARPPRDSALIDHLQTNFAEQFLQLVRCDEILPVMRAFGNIAHRFGSLDQQYA